MDLIRDTPGRIDADPAVTIVLPTYNRARFLPRAFSSICTQTLTDWDLVVVDDGSTDDTAAVVSTLSQPIEPRVTYVRQPNGGAYAARNTGLEHARGQYVAFFDSDDEWLPHHLQDCHAALEANRDVDWVYGASRIVDDATGLTVSGSSFEVDGRPRPFRRLRCQVRGRVRVLDEPDLASAVLGGAGLFCGLQNSLIRREVFEKLRFHTGFHNEAEDQVFVIRALVAGFRFAYIDAVHHLYHVHEGNSSGSSRDLPFEKQVRIYSELIRGFEELPRQVPLTASQQRALVGRLSREYFWHLGFATYWQSGRRQEALAAYRKGLRLAPWHWRYWKTYLLALVRSGPGTLEGAHR